MELSDGLVQAAAVAVGKGPARSLVNYLSLPVIT